MSRKVKKSGNTKKFIIIGAAAALLVSTIAIAYNPGPPARSNTYIQEFVLPSQSAAPVGITVDSGGMVWFAESGTRKIGKFDPSTEKFTEYALPGSQQQQGPNPIASIWVLKFDKDGNLWFPDVTSNAIWKFDPQTAEFETYRIPTSSEFGTSYPINLEFDDDGKIWFSEIYGKNLGVLDPTLAQHNTNKGVTEIPPATNLETLGPLALDDDGNIWFTALTYPISGKLMKFDPKENSFTTYSMPQGITSPVGIAPADDRTLWINDHGTSM
ncbi:MAG: virginiamycin B lyase family protein, partial [Nitrososphaerales archaeon]